ncbi:unnamed protein product [Nezara viridula]|uniref:Uncharacterized protein n=1 Tax=Nezara viridula TaxID=85310 RepID=A0A9P0E5T9_NEZVI|nr:unnamed protein product [Nezara viridula]
MKVFCLLFLVVIIQALPNQSHWQQFKVQHQKKYLTIDEEQKRMDIFLSHQRYIEEHNKNTKRSKEEYLNLFRAKVSASKAFKSESFQKSVTKLPEEVDWRESGAVTPVKDQGTCVACWAFSVTGAIEGRLFLKTKKLVSLSEQQLVDCSKNNDGCNGGDATEAYEYLKYVDGIEAEEIYPYRALAGNCSTSRGAEVTAISGYLTLPSGDEAALQEAVAAGPVSLNRTQHGNACSGLRGREIQGVLASEEFAGNRLGRLRLHQDGEEPGKQLRDCHREFGMNENWMGELSKKDNVFLDYKINRQ